MTIRLLLAAATLFAAAAQEFTAPAGVQSAQRRPGATSVLPGGRTIRPLGRQFRTGPGAFGLAVSPNSRFAVTADGGPNRFSLTVIEPAQRERSPKYLVAPRSKADALDEDDADWRSVSLGITFENDRQLFVSEGNSGKVRLVDAASGKRRRSFDLNGPDGADSFAGDLAYDRVRRLLYVLDQANFRLVIFDTEKQRLLASQRVGRLPFAIALSPDGKRVYITNIGTFEYQPVPGAKKDEARMTGLPFPAFGFPSRESMEGAERQNAAGQTVRVPGLGDPNTDQANSLCIVNVENAAAPRIEGFVRTGLPFGKGSDGGSSPSGVIAIEDEVFVSNGHHDSITVVDPRARKVVAEIPIRIPNLERYRGVLPIGMAWHPQSGWIVVAEAGINAVGVIDRKARKLLGHIPAAWFPTRVAVAGDDLFVANAKGTGTGPNASVLGDRIEPGEESFAGVFRRGSVSHFALPAPSELAGLTRQALEQSGLVPARVPAWQPPPVKHVVIIVKENRTYDDVFGDLVSAGNSRAMGLPSLARYGSKGLASGGRDRLSVHDVNVTPNHREMVRRWAFSDNFYADSEVSTDGHHWLVGSYPNAWTESTLMAAYGGQKDFRLTPKAPGRLLFAGSNSSVHPEEILEAGTLWHHLERHGITFRNFGEGFELAGADEGEGLKPTGARYLTNVPMPDPLYRNTSREYPNYNTNIPDQFRADQFIAEIRRLYEQPGAELPRLLYIHLPNDHIAKPRPEDGYPYDASFVADNDYALGRILEYLSGTRWWPQMTVFATEDDAQGGRDHIDSHRTVFLAAGPYVKKNYVSHVNASFPSMLKTTFRLLGIPPMNLYDATAADLRDLFTNTPETAPYKAIPPDPRIFVASKAREPRDARPSARMDDPRVLREQHREMERERRR